jgi:hypothetical protein
MQLSDHFTLAEMTVTNSGLNNTPPQEIIDNLILLADFAEGVRHAVGDLPVRISSGYRSPAVNAKVGGSKTSQHMRGEAMDFTVPAFGTPFQVCCAIVAAKLPFDQLIYEQTWVHVSRSAKPRGDILTFRNGAYQKGLIP